VSFYGGNTEEKERLRNNYEQLRTYALSPVKSPSQPLGLDLWGKKGFLAWSLIILHKETPTPTHVVWARNNNGTSNVTEDLLMPLTNILNDWSNRNGGLFEHKNQARTPDP